jgi:hypothetical protein
MRKIGEGREAEILEWDASHVLRLMRDPHAASRLARERSALVAAREGGAPAPAVGDLVTIDGRPGLVMERVRGRDLISDVARRPWTIVAASGALGRAPFPETSSFPATTSPSSTGRMLPGARPTPTWLGRC